MENLKLVAFDLDGTIWCPDMYQLWGGGAPFKESVDGKELTDCIGNKVRLLGISADVLRDLYADPFLSQVKVAWVSCTDEPEWATECLSKFKFGDPGISIDNVADVSLIFKANKQVHFRNLKELYPDIDYASMLFFDNEFGNVKNVSSLGVRCIHCPDGLTQAAWNSGLALFHS